MNKRWKIGVVYDTSQKSKGHHGNHFSFTGLPEVELVLADSNCENIEQRMQEIGAIRHYSDYLQMLEKESLDIVTVCSRLPGDHFEIIRAAVKTGCHVLCEKPLTASLEEADEIISLSERYKKKIAVSHLARYALVFRTVKKMIEEGEIGQPLTFYGRGKEDERGGGEDMLVLGTHILDLSVFLFGIPEYIFADVRTAHNPITCKDRNQTSEPLGICAGDSVWANLKFKHGINGIFESRRGLCKGPVRMGITVAGTEGCISVRYDMERKLRISRSPFPPEDEAQYDEVDLLEDRIVPENALPLDYQHYGPSPSKYFADNNRFAALDLLQAIEENRQPVSSVYDAVSVLEIIYGIYASSLERKPFMFPLVERTNPLNCDK